MADRSIANGGNPGFRQAGSCVRLLILTLAVAVLWLFRPLPLSAQQAQCSTVAEEAPLDFILRDMHGNDVALADYAGDVILLDFWATWCAPCRIEIPGFIELLDQYEDRGFSVLGVSINDSVEDLLEYAEELGMDYPVLVGDGHEILDAYGPLVGFPTTVIIDREGRICQRHVGFTAKEQFDADIRALL